MSNDGLEETFAKLRRPSARRETKEVDDWLDRLDEEHRTLLARYEGQSLTELEENIQLLPLGTRILLEAMGAIKQTDTGEHVFRVKALPYALEVVAAAAHWRDAQPVHLSKDLLDSELTRIWSERFELTEAPKDGLSEALPEKVQPLGTFSAQGTLEHIDEARQVGAIKVLGKTGHALSRPAQVHCDLDFVKGFHTGELVDMHFAVGLVPKPSGLKALLPRLKNVTELLQKSVDNSPGLVFVTLTRVKDAQVVSFDVSGPQPNAVAQLTALEDAAAK